MAATKKVTKKKGGAKRPVLKKKNKGTKKASTKTRAAVRQGVQQAKQGKFASDPTRKAPATASGVTNIKDLPLAGRSGKSIYTPIVEKMARLRKEGQAFEVKPPQGVDIKKYSMRLTNVLTRKLVTPPAGLRFAQHETKNGTIAIYLKKAEPKRKK